MRAYSQIASARCISSSSLVARPASPRLSKQTRIGDRSCSFSFVSLFNRRWLACCFVSLSLSLELCGGWDTWAELLTMPLDPRDFSTALLRSFNNVCVVYRARESYRKEQREAAIEPNAGHKSFSKGERHRVMGEAERRMEYNEISSFLSFPLLFFFTLSLTSCLPSQWRNPSWRHPQIW